jgi:predicted metal-dependent peptidase
LFSQLSPFQPPTGYDKVIPAPIYQQLLAVHNDLSSSIAQKKQQIDEIMAKLPRQIIDRLPLPAFVTRRLPLEIQQNLRKMLFNFQVSWDDRSRQLRQYIRTLPKAYRRAIRGHPYDELKQKLNTVEKVVVEPSEEPVDAEARTQFFHPPAFPTIFQ